MALPARSKHAPIEAKAQAAGLGGVIAGVAIWALQTYVFKGSTVPAGLVSLVYAAVPGLLALGGAWLAPHTSRPMPPPAPVPPSNVTMTPPLPGGKPPAGNL